MSIMKQYRAEKRIEDFGYLKEMEERNFFEEEIEPEEDFKEI